MSHSDLTLPAGAPLPHRPPAHGTTRPRARARDMGPVVALLGLVVAFTALNGQFATADNALNILREASILLLIALAGTFIILMGSIDLSVGAIVTVCGVGTAVLATDYGANAVLLVPLLGLVCGALNGLLVAFGRLPSFIVTLGTLFIFNGAALYMSGGTPVTIPDGGRQGLFGGEFAGTAIPTVVLWALTALVLCAVVALSTRFGRCLYGIGGGEAVMSLSGVRVRRYKFYAFLLAGGLAGLGGLLLAFRVGAGSPDMGGDYLLTSIAAIVIGGTPLTGGVGGPQRTIIGVLILAILANGMTIAGVGPFLQTVVQGVVVVIAVALTFDRSKVALVK